MVSRAKETLFNTKNSFRVCKLFRHHEYCKYILSRLVLRLGKTTTIKNVGRIFSFFFWRKQGEELITFAETEVKVVDLDRRQKRMNGCCHYLFHFQCYFKLTRSSADNDKVKFVIVILEVTEIVSVEMKEDEKKYLKGEQKQGVEKIFFGVELDA